MTEKEYRGIDRESYSSLALFSDDRKSYYRKYIVKERRKREEADHFVYGSLVDCLLFTPEEFDDRFVVGTFDEPRPLMKKFIDNLVKHVVANNATQDSFRSCLQWAYNDTKYDATGKAIAFKTQTFDSVVKEFQLDTGYYDFMIDSIVEGKLLISTEDYDKAKIAVNTLRTNTTTGPLLLQEPSNGINVFHQLVVLYEIDGIEFKSMLDLVIVNHNKKSIKPYDLKTTHNAEQFPFSYLKFNYYIQHGVYSLAIKEWAKQQGLVDYNIEPFDFIVIDSYNYMDPLVYTTDDKLLSNSLNGFTKNGKLYKGIYQLVGELKWHKGGDIWTISYDNYYSGGFVDLIIGEDEERGNIEGAEQDIY